VALGRWSRNLINAPVKLARLSKAKAELLEDKDQLTIALDAKQLEIGMLKRRNHPRDSLTTSTTTQQSHMRPPRRSSAASSVYMANTTMETPMPRAFARPDDPTAKKQTTIAQPRRISFAKHMETPLDGKRRTLAPLYQDKENTPPANAVRGARVAVFA
jgi:hypothetical protein